MATRIHQNPDGSISYNDERYRLNERGDHQFDVVREGDGAQVGAFRLLPGGSVEVEEGEHGEVVEAVANLLAVPRGLLPLQ